MILILSLIILYMFYAGGGFRYLIKAAQLATEPEPETMQYKPEPVKAPPAVIISEPEPPKIERQKLEKIARNCLSACGVTFDTYYYCRNKTDLELMDIIKDYDIYHT